MNIEKMLREITELKIIAAKHIIGDDLIAASESLSFIENELTTTVSEIVNLTAALKSHHDSHDGSWNERDETLYEQTNGLCHFWGLSDE